MEFITLAALSTFIAACLKKAGEKVSEKAVEKAFESRRELAEKLTGLFKPDLIQLGLRDSATPDEIDRKLSAQPKILEEATSKLQGDVDTFKELLTVLRETSEARITVNNFANQTNNDKAVNIVGDNTKITF